MSHLLFIVDELHSLLASPLLNLPFQSGVIVILYVVVSASREVLSNLRPTIAVGLMEFKDAKVLLSSPLNLLDIWVQVIVPSETEEKLN